MERSIVILKEKDGGFLRAEVGRDVSMSCEYRMSGEPGDSLYSIKVTELGVETKFRSNFKTFFMKWYRDDQEFFRYIPTGEMRGDSE